MYSPLIGVFSFGVLTLPLKMIVEGMGGVIRLELLGGVVVSKDIGSGVGSHIESEETPHPDY